MKNIYLYCCCLFLFATLSTTSAQDVDPSDDIFTEEFFTLSLEDLMSMEIESAGKKAEKISDIPASVVVITRNEIEKLGYTSLEDILENIPGLYSIGDAYFFGGTNYGVRGFASSGSFNDMMIMVNGVNQMEDVNNSFSTDRILVPVESIDRIEVIRGPMSVIYGSSAFMGAINIITNENKEEGKLNKVSGTVASLGTYGSYSRLGGTQDNFSYTVNANSQTTDGRSIKLNEMNIADTTGGSTDLQGRLAHIDLSTNYKGLTFGASYNIQKEAALGLSLSSTPSFYQNEYSTYHVGYKHEVSKKIELEGKLNLFNYNLELPSSDSYSIVELTARSYEYEIDAYLNFSEKYNAVIGFYNRVVYNLERTTDVPFCWF